MKFRKFKREYLVFSRKERNASVALVIMIMLVAASPFCFRFISQKPVESNYASYSSMFVSLQPSEQLSDVPEQEEMQTHTYGGYVNSKFEPEPDVQRELFYFDPNKITIGDWVRLGVPESIASRIINYKQNGGSFKSKEDLMKIYGFREKDFIALGNYIVFEQTDITGFDGKADFVLNVESGVVELNSATETDLISLGFSAALSKRIINYRNSLGGIYAVQQLEKVYGMQPEYLTEVADHLRADVNSINKINLNTCSIDLLMQHGYISDQLAAAIIEYRTKTGRFVSLSEVTKVKGMYPDLFEKLKPYLTI